MILPEWGEAGQQRLKEAVVFVAGAGGLGSPAILYMAAAGVGRIRVCDAGEVEPSNLNRQILYADSDLGRKKGESVKKAVARINSHVTVEELPTRITRDNVSALVGGAHLMLDCLDNFDTRFILNLFSFKRGVPMVHAGVSGLTGQVVFIHPPHTPCLACMMPEVPSGGIFPILGATAGVVGSIQALEALKHLSGSGSVLEGRMLLWDGSSMKFHIAREQKNPHCLVCGGS